ncbi:MAG: VOC family protein [Gemmatimonadales bacterium]|nr:VOC family protein [Gemmatimonadales bacterium]
MRRVTGIGGIFLKAADPTALGAWYRTHLGLDMQEWGGAALAWNEPADTGTEGMTLFTLFRADSAYFPGACMVNFRVPDLDALVAALRAEGCAVDERVELSEYGRFGWVTDPEGNRIELWQPPASSPG